MIREAASPNRWRSDRRRAGIGQKRPFVGATRNDRLRIRKQSLGNTPQTAGFEPKPTFVVLHAHWNKCLSPKHSPPWSPVRSVQSNVP